MHYEFDDHVNEVTKWAEDNRFSADQNILDALDAFNERKANRYGKLLKEKDFERLDQSKRQLSVNAEQNAPTGSALDGTDAKIETKLTALQIVEDKEAYKTLLEDVSERKAIKIGYNTTPKRFSKFF